MENSKLNSFNVIGLAIKTSNAYGQAGQDIPNLWTKFMSESIMNKIPNKVDNDIFCIYTNYEGDHTQPYTALLGCKVSSLKGIPDDLTGMTFEDGVYKKYVAKGDITKGLIWNKWLEIWNADLKRTYMADFEVYGSRAINPEDAEVDIYISVSA